MAARRAGLERLAPRRDPRSTVSASTRYYVHGPGGQILSEFEETRGGNLMLIRDYVYAGNRLLAHVKPSVPAVQVSFVRASSSPGEAAGTLDIDVQVTTADEHRSS